MNVQKDIDLLRQFLQYAPSRPSREGGEAAFDKSSPLPTPLAAAPSAPLQMEVSQLSQQVADLTAELAASKCSRTTAELYSTSLREANTALQLQVLSLQTEMERLATQKQAESRSAQQLQRSLCNMEHHVQSMETDFQLLQQDYKVVCESQWESVLSATAEVQNMCRLLTDENVKLKDELERKASMEKRLEAAEQERQRWEGEAEALSSERQAWETDWLQAQQYVSRCKTLSEQLQTYWEATQTEHRTLQETVQNYQKMITNWETSFSSADLLPPLPSLPPPATVCDGSDSRGSQEDEDPKRDPFVSLLEAKTIDLALGLNAALTECDCQAKQLHALGTHQLLSVSEGIISSQIVQSLRTVSETLLARNQELEARAISSEHFSEALMELYQHLMDEYTAEVHHTHTLEVTLTERLLAPAPNGSAAPSASSGLQQHIGSRSTRFKLKGTRFHDAR